MAKTGIFMPEKQKQTDSTSLFPLLAIDCLLPINLMIPVARFALRSGSYLNWKILLSVAGDY
jgi:hypothetical protein